MGDKVLPVIQALREPGVHPRSLMLCVAPTGSVLPRSMIET